MLDTNNQTGTALLGSGLWLVVWSLVKIIVVVLPLMI
jgi:NADH-quinone oxidoreductase subunit H